MLTDNAIRSAKPHEKKPYKLFDKRGLLLVAPSGMAAGVALMAARELWINARRELASDVDPGAKRLLARGARSAFSHEH